MEDMYIRFIEPTGWLAIQAGWLMVAIIALRKAGGNGASLFFLGTVGGLLAQLVWSFETYLSGAFDLYDWVGGYGSWASMTVGILGLSSYAVMGVGFLLLIMDAAGARGRLKELEVIDESYNS